MNKILRKLLRKGMVKNSIYRFGILAFLYAIVNGTIAYILPIYLENSLNNLSLVGIILGVSSIFNVLTDIIVGVNKKPPSYVFMMRLIGVLTLISFLSLWFFDTALVLIIVVCIWGIFTELYNFSVFDFVSALQDDRHQAWNFGYLNNLFFFGSLLAPVIVAPMILVDKSLTLVTGTYFVVGLMVVFNLFVIFRRLPQSLPERKRRMNFLSELNIWRKIYKKIYPILTVSATNGLSDGALTSFIPIFALKSENLANYGGIIMASFYLPMIIFSSFWGNMSDKNGNKKLVSWGLGICLVASLVLGFSNNFILASSLIFLIGLGYSIFLPSIMAEQNRYISKHHSQESRVVSQSGIAYNLGFILGASLCGVIVARTSSFGLGFGFLSLGWILSLVVWGKKRG